jgi:hypothetical protein
MAMGRRPAPNLSPPLTQPLADFARRKDLPGMLPVQTAGESEDALRALERKARIDLRYDFSPCRW